MTPLGWSGWDQERVMLSMVRLTWCMIDTVEGAEKKKTETYYMQYLKIDAKQVVDMLQYKH